jgi:hypothetical protein
MMVIGNSIDDREETQVLTAIKCFLCPVSLRGRGREGERERERFFREMIKRVGFMGIGDADHDNWLTLFFIIYSWTD